jgi:hypothetical protein
MPRLKGYRERINCNLWDCFAPRDLAADGLAGQGGTAWLFGNRNIGNYLLTNLQVAGQLLEDRTMVILNWYARSNVAEIGHYGEALATAWHAWKHATIATLYIGSKPLLQRPLWDLMGPRDMFGGIGGHDQGGILLDPVHDPQPQGHPERARYAMAMYKAYRDAQGSAPTGPFPEGVDPKRPPHGWETWEDLTPCQRQDFITVCTVSGDTTTCCTDGICCICITDLGCFCR